MQIQTTAPGEWRGKTLEHLPLLKTSDGTRIVSRESWEQHRATLKEAWLQYLGTSPFVDLPLDPQLKREEDFGTHTGRIVYLQMEPGYFEQCYLMVPQGRNRKRRPAVVVFYYDVDVPSGHNLGSPRWKPGLETRHFARHLVERGYVAFVQRWVHEGYVELLGAEGTGLQGRYARSVKLFQRKFAGWKGLGRVVWDASRCIDYLVSTEYVDPERIGCMGHSLGGKMALYAGAFDDRYKAVVSSDLGIGLSFSNWEAPWYLGPEIREPGFSLDHHQLLALMAPRAFLLVAGEDADGDRSWPYLNSAQEVYSLYGASDRIGMFNHRSGHAPTAEANEAAYSWFDRWL
ncbi:MAG: prolyl oligopeptidase family serine peptidase [Limnochordia bacterium]